MGSCLPFRNLALRTIADCCRAVKLSSQVKQAVVEVEEYIRREGWPAVPSDIMKVRQSDCPAVLTSPLCLYGTAHIRLLCTAGTAGLAAASACESTCDMPS